MKSRNYNIKQIAENQSVLQIYLYGEIEPSYLNIWGDLVESKTSAEYIRKAIEKAGEIEGIELYINSLGGYVDEGVSIYNLLKRQSVPVTAYIDGMACSIASVVAMAADKIVMPSNTTMMIHHAIGGCYGQSYPFLRDFSTWAQVVSAGQALHQAFLKVLPLPVLLLDSSFAVHRQRFLLIRLNQPDQEFRHTSRCQKLPAQSKMFLR